jgi:PadR family transcriptional regulator PadR
VKRGDANSKAEQQIYSGLVRLHILHHACEGPVFGLGMIAELRRHGYRLSPGTLYPLLHGMERNGLLRSTTQSNGRRPRRVYVATAKGRKGLAAAKERVRELFGELVESEGVPARPRKR